MELARGDGLVAQVTTDGCHVLVHEEPPPAGRDSWRVFAATTGRQVAVLTHDAGAHDPAIVGERALYVVERRALRARALESDTLMWELGLAAGRRSAAPRLRQ